MRAAAPGAPSPGRPSRRTSADRSTLPDRGERQRRHVEPPPRTLGRGQGLLGERDGRRARSSASVSAAATTWPSVACGTPTTTTAPRRPSRRAHSTSATSDRRPAGDDRIVATPGDDEDPVGASSHGRPRSRTRPLPAERSRRAVVPLAEVGRPHPDLAVAHLDLHPGERREAAVVGAPGDEGQLRGAVVVADHRAGRLGTGPEPSTEPVTRDGEVEPGQRPTFVEGTLQQQRREVGVGRLLRPDHERGSDVAGQDGREEVHGGRERAGHPEPRSLAQAGQVGDVSEGPHPRLRRPDDGAGPAGGATRAESDPPPLGIGHPGQRRPGPARSRRRPAAPPARTGPQTVVDCLSERRPVRSPG